MIGIVGYGGYLPRLGLVAESSSKPTHGMHRSSRIGAAERVPWRTGTRTASLWPSPRRVTVSAPQKIATTCLPVYLVSSTLPFAERLNAGVLVEALTLREEVEALDMLGAQRAALSAVSQALARVKSGGGNALVVAADSRKTKAASAQELDYGDGAAAVLIGSDNVVAQYLGAPH